MLLRNRNPHFVVYSDDDKGGGGNQNGDPSGENGDNEKPTENGNGNPSEKPGEKSEEKPKGESEKKFTQDDVNKLISERLKRERERQDDEQKRKQGEFQKLYEELIPKHEANEKRLEELEAKVKNLSEATNNQINSYIEKWPKELKDLDPGTGDAEVRMAWYLKHLPLAKKIGAGDGPIDDEANKGNKGNGKTDTVGSYIQKTYAGPSSQKK